MSARWRHPFSRRRLFERPQRSSARRGPRRNQIPRFRMRPPRRVHVAAAMASPEERHSRPNLRLTVVGFLVVGLFAAVGPAPVVPPGGQLQVLCRRGEWRHAPHRHAHRPPGRHRGSQRHGAGGQRHRATDRALPGRSHRASRLHRPGGRLGGRDPQQVEQALEQSPIQSV